MSDEISTPEPEVTQDATPEVAAEVSPSESSSIFSEGFTFKEGWTDDLIGDQFDESRATLANYKDLGAVAKALVDNKRAATARTDGMVRVPTADSTPEDIAAYNEAIGIPDTLEGYEITMPEAIPEGVEFSQDDVAGFRELAYKIGITPEQASKIVEYQAIVEGQVISGFEANNAEHLASQQKALQDEWGNKWQQETTNAKRAAATFGLDPNSPAMQDAGVVKAMAKAASFLSEDKLVSGEKVTGQLSEGNQAADILSNRDNPLYEAFHDSNHPRHKEAAATYLHKLEEQTKREGF